MKICPICGKRYTDNIMFCEADGAGLVPMPEADEPQADESDELVGSRIFGDYIIKRKLGEGGMGSVYLAENASIDQRIAIKVLHGQAAESSELVKRFNREAQTIARLTHPNVIRVFIFGRTETNLIYLAMEFVQGRPLRDAIHKDGKIDEVRAINIMRQCLHALAEAHEIGIVHRDLKPDNIMLTRFRNVDDYVKVLDFGIAKVKEPEGSQNQKLTQAGVVYGTPEYLSPEQAQAKELDGRSDLYSMGVILYEMVTGQVPFQSNTAVAILAAHVYNEPQRPTAVARHKISSKMEAIIMKALQKDPNKRYQNAMEFLRDLEDLERDLIGEAATKTTMLDPRQLSLVMEASRAAAARRAGGAPGAAAGSNSGEIGVRTPQANADLTATTPLQTTPQPARTPAAAAPAAAQALTRPAAAATPAPVAKSGNQAVLYTVIGGLVALLILVLVLLAMVVKKQNAAATPAAEQSSER